MRLADIRTYPVKGLKGLSVSSADVEPWGLAGDRRWMVVDERGRFLSQRELPALARIRATPTGGGLRLSGDGRDDLLLAAPLPDAAVEVTVWRDRLRASAAGPEADAWLEGALGRPCRLVHMADPESARPVDPEYGGPGDRVSFADGFPLLLTTTASLADLADRAGFALSMDRFRTNLVIEGAEPWAEDGWSEIRVGEAVFALVKPCARCAVTTVDQDTGERHPRTEPLRTLAAFRRNARGQPIFGQNLIPRALGTIRVGDRVAVAG